MNRLLYRMQVIHLEQQSITVLKQLFEADKLDETYINEMKSDERKGIQKLIEVDERKNMNDKVLVKNSFRIAKYVQNSNSRGWQYVAWMVDAGRGPLAGPVVAAAVILPRGFKLLGLNDSNQLNEVR